MLNIIVPTDFSPLSKVAIHYAVRIAGKLKADITIIHVLNIPHPTRVSTHELVRGLEQEALDEADRDLKKLVREVWIDNQGSSRINTSVVRSTNFAEAVKKECERVGADLVVMGTKGASGLKKAVIGSNTVSVMENLSIPVLVVPEEARFGQFKDIVYATDLQNLDAELKTVAVYARPFHATIHVLHVAKKGADIDALEQQIDSSVKKVSYDQVVSLVLVDDMVEGALDQYLSVNRADALAMFSRKASFFEKLLDKSFTRNMAFHSTVPLLAFRKKS